MGFLLGNNKVCRNCNKYSVNDCFCNLHDKRSRPESTCADFQELSFLDKAFNSFLEYTPKVMDYMEKAQDRAREKEARKQAEIDAYKADYSRMSNQELQARIDQGASGVERAAIASIAQERRNEREKLQEFYSIAGFRNNDSTGGT